MRVEGYAVLRFGRSGGLVVVLVSLLSCLSATVRAQSGAMPGQSYFVASGHFPVYSGCEPRSDCGWSGK